MNLNGIHSLSISDRFIIYFSDTILRDLDSKMGGNVKNSFCLLMTAYMYYLSEVTNHGIISLNPHPI